MSRKTNLPSPTVTKLPVTRVSETRKVRKPLMEKKRRARINQSLNDLKRLLLESNNVKKEGSRPTKLEKADILELTVSHVQKLHGEQHRQVSEQHQHQHADETSKFKAGFSECARVVRDLLLSHRSLAPMGLEQRLSQHLDLYLNHFDGRNGRSPSPSSSCSSFESKESPESYRRQLLSNSPLLDDSWTNETSSSHVTELSHSQQSFSSSSSKMLLLDARPVWRPW